MIKKLRNKCTALSLILALLLSLLPIGFAGKAQAAEQDGNDIISFEASGSLGASIIDAEKSLVRFHTAQSGDRSNVTASVILSPGATISPNPAVPRSYTSPVTYTVTSASGVSKQWTVLSGFRAFPEDPFTSATLHGEDLPVVTKTVVPVTGQSFDEAYRIKTVGNPGGNWNVVLRIPIPINMPLNDVMLLSFHVNPVEALLNEQAAVSVTSRIANVNYGQQQMVTPLSFTAESGWTRVDQPFRNHTQSSLNGNGFAHFALGFPDQTIELGGFELYNYGNISRELMEKLPLFVPRYEGQEADAPWRAEAASRIEQIRKNDLTVQVNGANGQPISGAQVNVRMKNHEFLFGTAVHPTQYLTNATYRQKVQELFNFAMVQNELKQDFIDRFNGRQTAANIVNKLHADGFRQQAHTLVWPFDKNMPSEVVNLKKHPALLERRLLGHIESMVNMFPVEQIRNWDVMNEAANGKDMQKVLGDQAMVRWFEHARLMKPDARLYINDYDSTNRYTNVLEYITSNGVQFDGVGFQGHFGDAGRSMYYLQDLFNTLARYAPNIAITEFDMLTISEDLYADYLRDLLTLSFAHPSMESFTMWGFWDGQHWKNNGPFFKANWTPKKPLAEWTRLVFDEWWTDETGVTNADGQYKLRGFHGEYEVEIQHNGMSKTYRTSITKGAPTVLVVNAETPPNSDATLTLLEFDGKPVVGFTPQQLMYTVQVPYGQNYSGGLYAKAADENSVIKYDYPMGAPGDATVTVTAQDGTVNIYTLKLIYAPLEPVTGTRLNIVGATALGTTNPDHAADLAIDGNALTNWSGGSSITLDLGGIKTLTGINIAWNEPVSSSIQIQTSVDGSAESWWRVGGALHTPGLSTSPEPYSFKDLDFGYSDVFGQYVRISSTSGSLAGIREVEVFGVAAEAALSSIKVDGAPITGFAPDKTVYVVELPGQNTQAIPVVTATAAKESSTVTVTPAEQIPGTTIIKVLAATGNTETYRIQFVHERLISEITVNGQSLASFQPETYEYTVSLPAGTTQVPVVTAIKAKPDAEVAITVPTSLPGTARIEAERNGGGRTYQVHFEIEGAPKALRVGETTPYTVSLSWGAPNIRSSGTSSTYVDNFDSLDQMFESTGAWRIDTFQSLPVMDGDPARLARGGKQDTVSFTHKIPNITAFETKWFFHNSHGLYNGNNIRAFVSPDNETWTRVSLSTTPYVLTSGGWRTSTFTSGSAIPSGMNYLKWEVLQEGFAQAWSPMLGKLTVEYDPNASFYDTYEVYDSDNQLVQTTSNGQLRAIISGLEPDESYRYYVKGVDQQGVRTPQSNSVSVKTAALPPLPLITRSLLTPTANANGWHNSDVAVTLDASVAPEGITVTSITYSLSGAQYMAEARHPGQSASFMISSEGVTSAVYYARSAEGRKEPPQAMTVKLDKTAPVIHGQESYTAQRTETTLLNVTASDSLSGVASITAKFNGAEVSMPHTIPPMSLPTGSYVLSVTATDLAGNVIERSFMVQVAIDIDQLDVLLATALNMKLIKNKGVHTALLTQVNRLQNGAGKPTELLRELNTFENQVQAMSSNQLDPKFASDLLQDIAFIRAAIQ